MSWECAECHVREGADRNFIDAVCHHCGKPLCHQHRVRLADDAFSDVEGQIPAFAMHCRECKQLYHPRAIVLEPQEEKA